MTKYKRVPLSQGELNYNLMSFHTSKNYSKLVADTYIPAISSALDLHMRTIQNISRFYGVVNTYLLASFINKKTVKLIIIDGIYQPVVSKQVDAELPASAPASLPASTPSVPDQVSSEYSGTHLLSPQTDSKIVVQYSQKIYPSPWCFWPSNN